jgi:hypothetical protein
MSKPPEPIVIPAPKPLSLRKIPMPVDPGWAAERTPSILPPSYPMAPADVGMDLFSPEENSLNGITRLAPFQHGEWRLQPSYNRAFPFVYDLDSGDIYSRSLMKVTPGGWSPDKVMAAMSKFNFHKNIRWLHCLRLHGLENNSMLTFGVCVLDFIAKDLIHSVRRQILENCIPELGFKVQPKPFEVFLVPEFPEMSAEDLWIALHLTNAEWRKPFYTGIVAKDATAPYFVQMVDHQHRALAWLLHKFENPIADVQEENAS